MYDLRLNLARQVAAEAREYFGDRVYRTSIPRNVRLAEAPSFGQPMQEGEERLLADAERRAEDVARHGRRGATHEGERARAESAGPASSHTKRARGRTSVSSVRSCTSSGGGQGAA